MGGADLATDFFLGGGGGGILFFTRRPQKFFVIRFASSYFPKVFLNFLENISPQICAWDGKMIHWDIIL